MGLFGSVSGKQVDEFAKTLAQEVAKRYPPTMDQGSGERKVSQKRLSSILEEAFEKAVAYKAEHKLGVYKKARLSNTFRWELQELGYTEKFVEVATEGLVVYISRKQ
ncbi:MAG: hypothetical protein FJY54_12915 [Betaproteobacteria bacterium]|nr:hypothetical protein [Betaproteobacteria bacterium]